MPDKPENFDPFGLQIVWAIQTESIVDHYDSAS